MANGSNRNGFGTKADRPDIGNRLRNLKREQRAVAPFVGPAAGQLVGAPVVRAVGGQQHRGSDIGHVCSSYRRHQPVAGGPGDDLIGCAACIARASVYRGAP